ncbi:hypothetical protein FRC12_015635 [Ceratobasidium sp. 428]|nr:hypothetical protein FRC12_015635 [Ceratobasidium sp. 428]
MGWYSRQLKSSVKFQSIEHRRNLEGPFYHEFLLLNLTDGAVCKVERTGEGSRTSAIRSIGCTARDLIQWLSKDDSQLHSIKAASQRIAEIDLGREFDVMDVLAICYSIQNTGACRIYTLQRYNCYFLCLTVLSTLTRRVASWETNINPAQWNLALKTILDPVASLNTIACALDQAAAIERLTSQVVSGLSSTLPSLIASYEPKIKLIQNLHDGEPCSTCITAGNFRTIYVEPRISAHAKRIAEHRLAAAASVIEDIEGAMRTVWERLPHGFGGAHLDEEAESEGLSSDILDLAPDTDL